MGMTLTPQELSLNHILIADHAYDSRAMSYREAHPHKRPQEESASDVLPMGTVANATEALGSSVSLLLVSF